MAAIVEVYGPSNSPYTNAIRMLAPEAILTDRPDGVAVRLADGRQIDAFEAVVLDHAGADPGLVSVALARDLPRLDQHLESRTFLIGNALSVTDRVVLGLLHAHVAALPDADLYRFCCVARWFDHVQWAVPALAPVSIRPDRDSRAAQKTEKKAKKPGATVIGEKSATASIQEAACFDIRIGRIIEVKDHPSDPALYVEQIDMGEGPRQIVSGLAKFVSKSDMMGRYVCVLVNIGACEIKGVASSGLVLCASNSDRTIVEPIRPGDGVVPGERIIFPGVVASSGPIETLKPKRMQKLLKLLKTTNDAEPYAVCADLPFMTGRGRVYSSPSLRNCPIK